MLLEKGPAPAKPRGRSRVVVSEVLRVTEDGVQVRTEGGKTPWLPRSAADFGVDDLGRRVVRVPRWLYERIFLN